MKMSWPLVTGVVTVVVLVSPVLSVMLALLRICVPLFSGLLTVTLKLTLPLAPGFWLPRAQTSGSGPPHVFVHEPTTYVVLAGIESTRVTLGATSLPLTLQFKV